MSKQVLRSFGFGLLAIVLILLLCALALSPQALAADDGPIRLDGSISISEGDPGQTVTITVPIIFQTLYGYGSVNDIAITPVMSTDPKEWPFEITRSPYTIPVTLSSNRGRAQFTFTISQEVGEGIYPIKFNVTYMARNSNEDIVSRQAFTLEATTYVRVLSDGLKYEPEEEEEEEVKGLVVVGNASTPSMKIEKDIKPGRVTLELPLINTSDQSLTNVSIEPVISSELDKFPFIAESQSYRHNIGTMQPNGSHTVTYDFQVSEHATTGNKGIEFMVQYKLDGKQKSNTVMGYVNIDRYKDEEEEEEDDKTSKPKLIISSYTISPDKVFAGTNFTLDMVFKNTSTSAIQNITISIINSDEENAYVVPAKSGSNTIYVRSLGPGGTIQKTLEMQVRPDTPAKPSMMNVTMSYEDSKFNELTETANITVPINQELRVVVDDPRIDNPFPEVGIPTYVYFNIINMGKSSIYNAMVSVEGPGLALEESLYAGTIQAGNQYSADFGIICSEAGEIQGEIIISFEDDFGDVQEERKPITLTVSEPYVPEFTEDGMMIGPDGEIIDPGQDPGMMDPGMVGDGTSSGVLKWVLGGVGVVALIVVIIVLRKRKMKKRLAELEEEDDAA